MKAFIAFSDGKRGEFDIDFYQTLVDLVEDVGQDGDPISIPFTYSEFTRLYDCVLTCQRGERHESLVSFLDCGIYNVMMRSRRDRWCEKAAAKNRPDWLKHFYEHGESCDFDTVYVAIKYGRLDALRYLLDNVYNLYALLRSEDESSIDVDELDLYTDLYVIGRGRMSIMRCLHEHGYMTRDSKEKLATKAYDPCVIAAYHNRLEFLEYFREIGYPWDWRTIAVASARSLECLRYAITNGCARNASDGTWRLGGDVSQRVMRIVSWNPGLREDLVVISKSPPAFNAAYFGNDECLKYLHSIAFPMDCAYYGAVLSGRIECVKLLRSLGIPYPSEAYSAAARTGHFYMFEFLYDDGCPWGEDVWRSLALEGRLDMLQFAIQHGAPIDIHAYRHMGLEDGVERFLVRLERHNGDMDMCYYSDYDTDADDSGSD